MTIKKYKILNFALSFYILIFAFSICFAAGLEVSPSRFDIVLDRDGRHAAEIRVGNPTADVQVFDIYADEYGEFFSFSPQSFTLESGAEKTVQMTVAMPQGMISQSQIFLTNVSVVSSPLAAARLQANAGIKIPLSISFGPTTDLSGINKLAVGAGLLALAAAIVWLVIDRQKSRKKISFNFH